MNITLGLDVGGAHLKAALACDGEIVFARQWPCPLWRGLNELDAPLNELMNVAAGAQRIAITMTGELSDIFPSRLDGERILIERLVRQFSLKPAFWSADCALISAEKARNQPGLVGSMNFLATATLAAKQVGDGMLIDMGSTTTDVIALRDGRPFISGTSDRERLLTGELVYTGMTRTSVATVAERAPFRGRWVPLSREHLATMADVYRVLGLLIGDADQHETADGAGKSRIESETRLARMISVDHNEAQRLELRVVASHLAHCHLQPIRDAIDQTYSRAPELLGHPVVVTGSGKDLLAAVLPNTGLPGPADGGIKGFETLVSQGRYPDSTPPSDEEINTTAPAVALALLASD